MRKDGMWPEKWPNTKIQKSIEPKRYAPEDTIANTQPPRPIANCDQEAWVTKRIQTASEMIMALHDKMTCAAERGMYEYGKHAVIEACAIEIIQTLGMEPEFINLRKMSYL